jgi:sorbitol-specific phosphotransferase system component IIC
MENLQQFAGVLTWLIPAIVLCTIWDAVWKLIGMWRAGRNNDLAWFICIAIFNTLGILPIIYILMDNSRSEEKEKSEELPKEKTNSL